MKHIHKLKTNLAILCHDWIILHLTVYIVWCVFQNQFFRGIMYINKEQSKQLPRKTLQFNLYLKKPK